MGSGTNSLAVLLSHETGCSIASPCSKAPFLGREELTSVETSAATCKQETTQDLPLVPEKSETLHKTKSVIPGILVQLPWLFL